MIDFNKKEKEALSIIHQINGLAQKVIKIRETARRIDEEATEVLNYIKDNANGEERE